MLTGRLVDPEAQEVGGVPGHGGECGVRAEDLIHVQVDGLASPQGVQLVGVE